MDYDDVYRGSPGPISADSAKPPVINLVTVVCPATGFLVSRVTSTAFLRNLVGTKTTGFVVFSITLNGTNAESETARTVVVQNLGPNTYAEIPASVQRVDACNSGETRTYYHTAHGSAGEGNLVSVEGKPRLVVEFFDTRI
jgi:hypothetical protein